MPRRCDAQPKRVTHRHYQRASGYRCFCTAEPYALQGIRRKCPATVTTVGLGLLTECSNRIMCRLPQCPWDTEREARDERLPHLGRDRSNFDRHRILGKPFRQSSSASSLGKSRCRCPDRQSRQGTMRRALERSAVVHSNSTAAIPARRCNRRLARRKWHYDGRPAWCRYRIRRRQEDLPWKAHPKAELGEKRRLSAGLRPKPHRKPGRQRRTYHSRAEHSSHQGYLRHFFRRRHS
jgi:hypothetical protein